MALITLPGGNYPKLVSGTTELRGSGAVLESFSGKQQVTVSGKTIWFITFQIPLDNGVLLRQWKAVLAQLVNQENTFRCVPPDLADGGPASGYSGTNPLVNGGSQLGNSLTCDNVSGGSVDVVDQGDYFHVDTASGRELKICTADKTSSGAAVTLDFEPALRSAPANNATVDLQDPVGEWRLVQPSAGWTVDAVLKGDAQIHAMEAITF